MKKDQLPALCRAAIPLLLLALSEVHHAAERVPQLQGVRTEEGQLVGFDRPTYLQRELAKRLPLDEPWPTGPALAKALARFGLDRDVPSKILPMPSRILGGVYLVGQSRYTNLTYMIDCGPEGVAIIDPSYDSEFELTLGNVEACGRSRKDIRWVINTHCHTDHTLADRKFRDLGARVIVHDQDAPAIEKGSLATLFYRYRLPEFPRCPVDHRLSDGEVLRLGDKVFYAIHTPGHTPGSTCFFLKEGGKNLLFSGDTVFFDGGLGLQTTPYADDRQYLASFQKLERYTVDGTPLRWDVLLPGHGAVALDRAYLDVQKGRERILHDLSLGRELLNPRYTPEYRTRMFGRPFTSLLP